MSPLDAARSLFDARGMRDAQIEDIARAVSINGAIVYAPGIPTVGTISPEQVRDFLVAAAQALAVR